MSDRSDQPAPATGLTRDEMALVIADSTTWVDNLLGHHRRTSARIAGQPADVCTTCVRPASEGNGPVRWPCAPGDLGDRARQIQIERRVRREPDRRGAGR